MNNGTQDRILLDIALSVGATLERGSMLRRTLPAWLRGLNCLAGSVLSARTDGEKVFWEPLAAIPRKVLSGDALAPAMGLLPDDAKGLRAFYRDRPILEGASSGDIRVAVLPLPEAGAFILAKARPGFDPRLLKSLAPLAAKLAQALVSCEHAEAAAEANRRLAAEAEARSALVRDLTDRERRLSAVIDAMPAGLLLVDAASRKIMDANPAACAMAGLAREDLVGRVCHRLVCPAQENRCPVLDLGQRVDNAERELLRADGSRMPVLKTVVRVGGEGGGYLVECFQDLSERHARLAAEAASQAKTDFLAVMSHEIRTPLSTVLGMLDLLGEEHLPEEAERYVSIARSSGRTLYALISDILDLSRIEAGQVELEPTVMDPAEKLLDICRGLETSAAAKGVVLTLDLAPDLPRLVMGDPVRFGQVVTNLVGNAIKFTLAGRVSVRAWAAPRDGGWELAVEVEDTGPGIPPDRLASVFEKFTQADAGTTRKYGGSGLGLTISRHLARLMGGDVTAESDLGRGSAFRFTGRFDPPPSRPSSPAPAAATPAGDVRPLRLLVADDNESNLALFRHYLKGSPHTVDEAMDGREAIRLAAASDYDLIFLDIEMPEMDGLDALRLIREDEALRGRRPAPVTVLTAHALTAHRLRAFKAGATGYLTKPFTRAQLMETLAGQARPN